MENEGISLGRGQPQEGKSSVMLCSCQRGEPWHTAPVHVGIAKWMSFALLKDRQGVGFSLAAADSSASSLPPGSRIGGTMLFR